MKIREFARIEETAATAREVSALKKGASLQEIQTEGFKRRGKRQKEADLLYLTREDVPGGTRVEAEFLHVEFVF